MEAPCDGFNKQTKDQMAMERTATGGGEFDRRRAQKETRSTHGNLDHKVLSLPRLYPR